MNARTRFHAQFEELEPRILYSADLAAALGLGAGGSAADTVQRQMVSTASPDSQAGNLELVFVDLAAPDAQTLIAGLQAQRDQGRPLAIHTIDAGEDGIELISRTLMQHSGVTAVHLLGHGSDGRVFLGQAALDQHSLLLRAEQVAGWGQAMSGQGDLLIYGCNVAAGAAGQSLMAALAGLTGLDVAASDDATGSAALGGDWALESRVGPIETKTALHDGLLNHWQGVLSNDVQVNTTTAHKQDTLAQGRGSQQSVAMDAVGNYVVVWTSDQQDGSNSGVFARRFAFDGTALTAEIPVNVTTAGKQEEARVVSQADGRFAVVWTSENVDGDGNSVVLRWFDSAGNPQTGEVLANTTTSGAQGNPAVGINQTSGSIAVAWQGQVGTDSNTVAFRRFLSSGAAMDAAEIRGSLSDSGNEIHPAVAMDSAGRVVLAFEDDNHMHFQRFTTTGGTEGPRTQVDNPASNSARPAIAMDANGNFTLVYSEEGGLFPGTWGRGYWADGSQRYPWFYPLGGDSDNASIAMDADGNFVVTFERDPGGNRDIYARKYNASGTASGSPFLVNQHTAGAQEAASVALLARNDFVVAWSGVTPADNQGVAARSFAGSTPIITSNGGGASASIDVDENASAVTTVTATDGDDAPSLIYSIVGGADAARFAIHASTGALTFTTARDFEAPSDVGSNNVYEVDVMASDGLRSDSQALAVQVRPVNEHAPVITSLGGVGSASLSMPENIRLVLVLQASDADLPADGLAYRIIGGVDAARFTITASSGELNFLTAPDFESPGDAGADQVYEVIVAVEDSGRSDSLALSVTVSDVLDTVDARDDSASTLRGQAITIDVLANDVFPANATPTLLDFSAASRGTVSQVGNALRYQPDAPYTGPDSFRYLASDLNNGLAHYWRLDGNATDLIGSADGVLVHGPALTPGHWGGALALDGIRQHAVLPDLSYSNNFSLSFWFRMDDNAGTGYRYAYSHDDVGSPNSLSVYFIEDSTNTASGSNHVLRTRLRDSNDADEIAGLDVPATGLADGQWHQYTLTVSSGSGSAVYVDGQLRASISSGGDAFNPSGSIYLGAANTLSATRYFKGGLDGLAIHGQALSAREVSKAYTDSQTGTDTATVTLTVNAPAAAPVIVSPGGGATAQVSTAEGTTLVTTVLATDADLQPLVYSISGGADAARFSLHPTTGVLSFVVAPDFEGPTDANADNVYEVEINASDGSLADTQLLSVNVTDVGSTLVVDTLLDTLDGDTSSTEALVASKGADGAISLREALTAANNTPGVQTVELGAGTHLISRSGAGDDLNSSDDFDLRDSVVITGAGAELTTISGGGLSAVLEIIQGTARVSRLTVADGWSTTGGTGIEVRAGATLLLSQAVVRNHIAQLASAAGIENAGNLALVDVEVRDNTAGLEGGGLRHVGSELYVERVTFAGNSSGSQGGAAYINGTSVTVLNATFSGNSAGSAGGALYAALPVTLTNVTFANNNSASGGAISASSVVSVRNTLFANSGGGSFRGTGSLLSLGNNLSTDHVIELDQGSDLGSSDAALEPLADNGGHTRTHALRSSSLAIDAGTSQSAPVTDQRGMGRFGAVDIGAYEHLAVPNRAPVHVLPALLNGVEDEDLPVVSISVADPNETDGVASWRISSTSLSVQQGTLNLSLAGGAFISSGANATASLTLQGSEVDINTSLASLRYRALPHYHGTDVLSISTLDGSGLSRQDTVAIRVAAVNDAPQGSSSTLTLDASLLTVLTRSSFGYSDHAEAAENHSLLSVLLQLPTKGSLLLDGSTLTAATEVTVAQLDANALVYEAASGASGNGYASLRFQVRDSGGSAHGGNDLDPTPAVLSFNVANRAPVFMGTGAPGSTALLHPENSTVLATLTAQDADAGDPQIFSISGGADAAHFEINSTTGLLRWLATPDFESPLDANRDGVYWVQVQVSDGRLSSLQDLSVQVLNLDEAPSWVSNRLVILEGGQATPELAVQDPDRAPAMLQFRVQGLSGGQFEYVNDPGTPISVFTQAELDAAAVRFVADGGEAAPDYVLVLSDASHMLAPRPASVVFQPVNDAPVVGNVNLGSSKEDEALLLNATTLLANASDPEGQALVVTGLRVQSGDAALQDLGGGLWRLMPASDSFGSISLRFEVSDGEAIAAAVAWLQVAPENDAPRFTNPTGGSPAPWMVAENSPDVSVLAASDVDNVNSALRFAIAAGADAGLFAVDAITGALRFLAAPDHEAPLDADRDGRYELVLQVTDGQATASQAVSIRVGNVDEAPVLQRQALLVSGTGGTLLLLSSDPEATAQVLSYDVVSTRGGHFEWQGAPGQRIQAFTQADVDAARVRFAVDGSALPPSFRLVLSDGVNRVPLPEPEVRVEPAADKFVVLATNEPVRTPASVDQPALVVAEKTPAASTDAPGSSRVSEAPDDAPPPLALEAHGAEALASPSIPPVVRLLTRPEPATSNGPSAPAAVQAEQPAAASGYWSQSLAALEWMADGSAQQRLQLAGADWLLGRSGSSLAQAMDAMRQQDAAAEGQGLLQMDVAGAALVSSGLSVGYVLWLARGGVLLASLMSSVPAWASVDPLPVLAQARRGAGGRAGPDDGRSDEEDSGFDPVDRLFNRARSLLRNQSGPSTGDDAAGKRQRLPEEVVS